MPQKRVAQRRRDSSENPKITLAVVQEQLSQMAIGQERILHILEGNGSPGLVQRVGDLEKDGKDNGQDLKSLLDRVNEIATTVGRLANVVEEHIRPDNIQHKTMLSFMMKNPKDLLFWVAIGFVALTFLNQSGALPELLKLLTHAS